MPRRSCSGTLSVPISKPRYTAVESQLMISPLKRSAMAIPRALLPVAVGPRIAIRRRTSSLARQASYAWYVPSLPAGRGLVVVERDGEEGLVVGILGRERRGRIR